MKKIITPIAIAFSLTTAVAQMTPAASPTGKIEQKVGLTDVTIQYSRPSKRGREIFGGLVPYNEYWRTGANENTKVTFSEPVIVNKDTLKAGTYALYTKPGKAEWEVVFYKDASNWGLPEKWDDSKVAAKINVKAVTPNMPVETFTMSIDNLDFSGATIDLMWDNAFVAVPFTVLTDAKVMANISKIMAGPSAQDYNSAAQYYLNSKKDLKQALEYSNKATELNKDAFWMWRTKSLIQAELGDKSGAVASAKTGLALAEKAGNKDYQAMFNSSIADWSKK